MLKRWLVIDYVMHILYVGSSGTVPSRTIQFRLTFDPELNRQLESCMQYLNLDMPQKAAFSYDRGSLATKTRKRLS